MSQKFVSRTNGLELHIPADMGAAVRFLSVGEDARRHIDDGQTSTRVDDPDQLKAELKRAQDKLAALEAKSKEQPVSAEEAAAAAPAPHDVEQPVTETARPVKSGKAKIALPALESDLA
jgi:hypothetical protein